MSRFFVISGRDLTEDYVKDLAKTAGIAPVDLFGIGACVTYNRTYSTSYISWLDSMPLPCGDSTKEQALDDLLARNFDRVTRVRWSGYVPKNFNEPRVRPKPPASFIHITSPSSLIDPFESLRF